MKFLISFLCLLTTSPIGMAQTEYKMSGPYEVVARDGQHAGTKQGSERDMKAAWDFAKAGEYEKAACIINAYAGKLQRLDGHDAPLCLIQGYWLCRAMTVVKSEKEKGHLAIDCDTHAWEVMLRRAMVPTMEQFERDSPYANGNWGAIVNRFRMAAAISMDDTIMYQAAVDYHLNGYDNGSLPFYVSQT